MIQTRRERMNRRRRREIILDFSHHAYKLLPGMPLEQRGCESIIIKRQTVI